jgi:hypothetical protein
VFVRADALDNFHYLIDPANPKGSTAGQASGASVNFTADGQNRSQTATIDGRLSYLIFGDQCTTLLTSQPYVSAVALAPFVSSTGTWNSPFKKTSNSAVQMGADFQVGLSTTNLPLFLDHFFYVSPYHQTDLRDQADINGVLLAWEAVAPSLYMDYGPVTPYLSFFWQLRAEAEFVNVNNPGLTGLVKGDHDWFGETVRANLGLFPANPEIPWPETIVGRISLIGTAQNFYDTVTSKTANYYTAQLQYKLGACKNPQMGATGQSGAGNTKQSDACAIQGSSAISFEYDWGFDKDTFVYTNQYVIKLSYSY